MPQKAKKLEINVLGTPLFRLRLATGQITINIGHHKGVTTEIKIATNNAA